MSEQPNALRLAKWLDAMPSSGYALPNQAATELRRLHEEVNEQARLLGMSAERELALLAKIDRLEKQLGEAVWNYGEKVRANQELLAPLKLVLEALDVLMTEPIAHKAADKAEYLLLEASPAIREALAEQPAQGCEFCSHPLYAGIKCKNCRREQSAQQQEPVAWVREHELPLAPGDAFSWVETFVHKTPLYTSPPASKPLTDEQKDAARYRWLKARLMGADFDWNESGACALVFEWPEDVPVGVDCDQNIDAAIEAAHGIKGGA